MPFSVKELRSISKEIYDGVSPLFKWAAVHHALERGATIDELQTMFPWLDLANETSPEPTPDLPEPEPVPDLSHPDIPTEALESIWTLTKLLPSQVDTIMALVSCAENGASNWPLFYNYIELGPDAVESGRGYTTTIFGACSGTGSLQKVFDHLKTIDPTHPLVVTYHDAMQRAIGGDVSEIWGLGHVGGDPEAAVPDWSKWTKNGRTHLNHIDGDLARLPLDDDAWRRAVWKAFMELNWVSAEAFCSKTGPAVDRPGPVLTSPIARGILVDTSLNHGDARYWKTSPTWKVIFENMTEHPEDERAWLAAFLEARKKVLKSGYAQLDWSMSGSRCDLWLDLLGKGNMDLSRPIEVANSTAEPHPIWPNGLILE